MRESISRLECATITETSVAFNVAPRDQVGPVHQSCCRFLVRSSATFWLLNGFTVTTPLHMPCQGHAIKGHISTCVSSKSSLETDSR